MYYNLTITIWRLEMHKRMILITAAVLLLLITACGKSSGNTEKNKDNNITAGQGKNNNGETGDTDKKDTEPEKSGNKERIKYEKNEKGIIRSEDAKKIIKEKSDAVINALSKKDAKALSEFVHPVKGLRFTPYTNVSTEKDVVMNKEQIADFFKDKKEYTWGIYDGKGDKILLTPNKYYDEFVYSKDFINAEKIGYNEVLSSGNITENQFEVYKDAIVTEYYFSGFNPDYGGADWQSLRLVFEEYENDWKLVGIIHNQWTT